MKKRSGSGLRETSPKSANYNFGVQNEPSVRMGNGQFSNLPREEIIENYNPAETYRDGLINSFAQSVRRISNISENQR